MAVKLEIKGADKAIASVNVFQFTVLARIEKQIDKSSKKIRNHELVLAPVRTGKYKHSIKRKFNRKELSAKIAPMYKSGRLHPLAHILERGTAPHPIHPYGNKKVTVQHPGTKPKPHIEPAWEVEQANFISGVENAVKGAKT